MVVIGFMVVVGIAVASVVVLGWLRSWGKGVARTESELHEPGARTMTYAVPAGQDPAVLMAALAGAGYRAVEETPERLLVGCPHERDDAAIRELLDHVGRD